MRIDRLYASNGGVTQTNLNPGTKQAKIYNILLHLIGRITFDAVMAATTVVTLCIRSIANRYGALFKTVYDIQGKGSAFACKDLICSFPGGGGCKSVRTLGGSGKVLPATGGWGGRISIFFAYVLYGRPHIRKNIRSLKPSFNFPRDRQLP